MFSLPHHFDIRVDPEVAHDTEGLRKAITQHLDIPFSDLLDFKILKRSIDARARQIKFQLRIAYYVKGEQVNWPSLPEKKYQHTNEQNSRVIVKWARRTFCSFKAS
jgi:uncharacterized FAD-dependent dehydrogenase